MVKKWNNIHITNVNKRNFLLGRHLYADEFMLYIKQNDCLKRKLYKYVVAHGCRSRTQEYNIILPIIVRKYAYTFKT